MAKVALRFYLDDGRDADLMDWLGGQANRSEAIRQALRAWIGSGAGRSANGLDTDTLRQVLREELGRIGKSAGGSATVGHGKEDDDLREGMDGLLSAWAFEEQE